MIKKSFPMVFVLLFLLALVPACLCAADSQGGDIAALDRQTFIVKKEFAGEIKLYLCMVEDNKILIRDSASIPYMVMEHSDLSGKTDSENPLSTEKSPIIKIVP